MYPATQCFLVEPTDIVRRFARCFTSGEKDAKCDKSGMGYHNAEVFFDEVSSPLTEEGIDRSNVENPLPTHAPWPSHCACGYEFKVFERHMFTDRIYIRKDTGETFSLKQIDKAPGAMYRAKWMEPHWTGADGKSYVVVLPNGRLWQIDGPASNCTMKDDTVHRCWIRHGEAPNFTVDKNGHTCSAGGGSIQAGDYHGFLRNGILTEG